MARLSPAISIAIGPCRRRSAEAAWCWDCRRAGATRLRTARANRRSRPAWAAGTNSGRHRLQSGIVDTSSTVGGSAVRSMTLRSHAVHQIGQQGDGMAARRRQHRRGSDRVSCGRRAPRSGRPRCLRRDRPPRRSRRCVRPPAASRWMRESSASQALGSSQSVIFSVRLSCSLSFRMGPSRKARSATAGQRRRFESGRPASRLGVVATRLVLDRHLRAPQQALRGHCRAASAVLRLRRRGTEQDRTREDWPQHRRSHGPSAPPPSCRRRRCRRPAAPRAWRRPP